jgi:hypothetical protein
MRKRIFIEIPIFLTLFTAACGSMSSIMGARFYRLSETERKIYVGLKGVDSTAADRYIFFESSPERQRLYDSLFQDRPEARKLFEERVEQAFREYGRYAPLLDDRIPIYVRYGLPTNRRVIEPTKTVGVVQRYSIKPAEIWNYKNDGLEFDFIRLGHAYKLFARTEYGERVAVPHLKELPDQETMPAQMVAGNLNFRLSYGRFRQKKNLTRLELYFAIDLPDTQGVQILRKIDVYDQKDSLLDEKIMFLKPVNAERGVFYDEVNLWLEPQQYRVSIELYDYQSRSAGKKELFINLLEYAEDVKEVSDLVPASLIDESFTAEKFQKPVGRVIPLVKSEMPVHQPFYFYHEVYNLETKNGLHQIRTTYQIYNLQERRDKPIEEEVVDVLIQELFEEGDVAYLAAKYHPMDLLPGHYLIVTKDKDLVSGKERTALGEFELVDKKQ